MSKYGARRTEYNGVTYHSMREANYAADLNLRVRARDLKAWEGQTPFWLEVNGKRICRYIIDFKLTNMDGTIEYHEVKGVWTKEAIIKRKLFQALYPDLTYTVIR